ncbi:DUF4199 domain-containing protein [Mucilaginibacter roseus]|uniref:DUF4199 domain-containing protein n=1 Tax=Mucilaginibacter roseus TaxID=1528868 RepID=A0ABS8U3Q5_9SPHI|nr:DUF4199 domain-containing protein [Mucilaginibacter roseus]MCD8740153.1 DUF4199 domain-containing protein [Mucilaginibacter roseus]
MADQVKSPTFVATKWAIINVVFNVILAYAFDMLNIDQQSPIRYIPIVLLVLFVFLAQKEYKDTLGGYITFGKAFNVGFRFALFAGILGAIFVFLYLKVLNPESFEKGLQQTETAMYDKGMSDADVDKSISMLRSSGPLLFSFSSAVVSALVGVVVSLIGAAIFKKERSPYEFNDATIIDDKNDPTL